MNKYVVYYRKSLRKHLACSWRTKERLLNQFEYALLFFLSDSPSPTTEDLHQAFGTPAEMAQTLMAEISPAEKVQYHKIVIFKRILIGISLAAFLVLTAHVYFYKEKPINVTNEVIQEATYLDETTTTETGGD